MKNNQFASSTSFVPCPICGYSDTHSEAKRAAQLRLTPPLSVMFCTRCSHWFLHPLPAAGVLEKYYASSPGYDPELFRLKYSRILIPQYKHLLHSLGNLVQKQQPKLLDFGCGDGALLQYAQSQGWQATGYEPTERLAAAARERGILSVHSHPDLATIPIPAGSIDIIYCAHVLEHLPNPRSVMEWFSKWLRPGGILSIQVPNQFRNVLWPFLYRRWMKRDVRLGYNLHHLQFYTTASLRRLVESFGFKPLEISTRFELRNRRALVTGRYFPVRTAKLIIYWCAGYIGRGPNIEVFACRQS